MDVGAELIINNSICVSWRLCVLRNAYKIENIRGRGLLIAFDLMEMTGLDLVNKCLNDKLLINSPKEKSIRLMPPLVVSENEIEEMLTILKNNLAPKKAA